MWSDLQGAWKWRRLSLGDSSRAEQRVLRVWLPGIQFSGYWLASARSLTTHHGTKSTEPRPQQLCNGVLIHAAQHLLRRKTYTCFSREWYFTMQKKPVFMGIWLPSASLKDTGTSKNLTSECIPSFRKPHGYKMFIIPESPMQMSGFFFRNTTYIC